MVESKAVVCRSFEGEVFVSRGQLPASTGAGSLAAGAVAGQLVPVAVTGICTMSDRLYDRWIYGLISPQLQTCSITNSLIY